MTEITHFENSEQTAEDHIPIGSDRISVDGLTALMRRRPRGVSGPAPKEMLSYVSAEQIVADMSEELGLWAEQTGFADRIALAVNKLSAREGVVPEAAASHEFATRIARLTDLAGRPNAGSHAVALERLVLNLPAEEAEGYLSNQYVDSLAELAEDETFRRVIQKYFTLNERLNRSAVDREAPRTTRELVEKAVMIRANPRAYLDAIASESDTSDSFVEALTPHVLLDLVTSSPANTDEALMRAREQFEVYAELFPHLAEDLPSILLQTIVRRGSGLKPGKGVDEGRLRKYLAQQEAAAALNRPVKEVGQKTKGFRAGPLLNQAASRRRLWLKKRPETDAHARAVPVAAFSVDYQKFGVDPAATLEVMSSKRLTKFEKRELFNHTASTVDNAHRFAAMFAEAAGAEEYSDSIFAAAEEKIAKIIQTIPDLLQGDVKTAVVTHSGQTIERLIDGARVAQDGTALLDYGFRQIVMAQQGKFSESTIRPSEGAGRFVNQEAGVAVTVRPEGDKRGEQRLGHKIYVPPARQKELFGRVYDHRPSASFDIRLDLEDMTGRLSFDFGGMTSPLNELVAALVSAASQHHSAKAGHTRADSDYHSREHFEPHLSDPDKLRAVLNRYMYSLDLETAGKVPDVA